MSAPPFGFGGAGFGVAAFGFGNGANQLSIYNGALAAMGERPLLSVLENRSQRRRLDDVWNRNGVLTCLAAGLWNFADRTAQWDYGQDFTPQFGYQCAYQLPVDWVRPKMICEDERFQVPHLLYRIESGYLFSDLQRLYVSWVSSDPQFGGNMAAWPQNFCRMVEHYFASMTVMAITRSEKMTEKVMKGLKDWTQKAKATDAMDESTQFLPPGSWSQARHGRRRGNDMGNPNRLIG